MSTVSAGLAPTAQEQELLELINRARLNPQGEYDAIIADGPTQTGTTPDVTAALRYFGVDAASFEAQLSGLEAVDPLAWSGALSQSATTYSELMIAQDEQSHNLTDPDAVDRADRNDDGRVSLSERILDAGYSNNWSNVGENIFAYGESNAYTHAAFFLDWGYDAEDINNGQLRSNWQERGDGIQDPAGHRDTIMSETMTEIGIAIVEDDNVGTAVGPNVVTQHFGARRDYTAQLVGVVIDDEDGDEFYDIGEGLGGVTVTATRGDGLTATTTSWASGGYQIELLPGTYTVTFSGGALDGVVTRTIQMGNGNQKFDAIASNATQPEPEPEPDTGNGGGSTTPPDGENGNEGGTTEPNTDGDDTLVGTGGDDTLEGGAGADELSGGAGNDSLDAGAGNDLAYAGLGQDTLDGGAGNDTLYGAGDDDVLNGGDDDDLLGAGAGNDTLDGGDGNDALWTSAGDDSAAGGAGNDTLGGATGNDSMDGGTGADELWGAAGNDTLLGGAGNDTLGGSTGDDVLRGEGGMDELWGSSGADVLDGGAGDDQIGAGIDDDIALGGDGNDTVSGGLGNDTLNGDAGDDIIYAASGNDVLKGGAGNDTLYGGAGEDVFVYGVGDGEDVFYMNGDDDRLQLDDALWLASQGTLTAAEVVSTYGSQTLAGLSLDFGDGNSIAMTGVADLSQLTSIIDIA